jgi:hypothetical protein
MMELAGSLPARRAVAGRLTFLQKPVAAAGLIAMADLLFYHQRAGSTVGLFCLSLLTFVLISRPEILRHRAASLASVAAGVLGLILVEQPGILAGALFWLSITLAVLLPKAARFDDGWRWAKRLALHLLRAIIAPVGDMGRGRRAARRRPIGLGHHLPVLVLPVLGSLLFLALFARANPLIGNALAGVELGPVFGGLYPSRLLFWLAMLIAIWSLLRPRPVPFAAASAGHRAPLSIPGISVASVTLSLCAFNALFAVENILDLAFLWGGAPLPDGMSLADYAHRGAYPLIVTALLAGLFVLTTLQPGSPMSEKPLVRRLVYMWIGQNILLVASTMLRTLDYIDAYSLTRLRIAALVWMGLVAVGLALICYRVWRRRSATWLINANLAAALLALAACSFIDLGRVAAAWNVRQAGDPGGRAAGPDICYLASLGSSALLPLIELEGRVADPILKERVGWARIGTMRRLTQDQADWRGWTFRGARRLEAAREAVARRRLPAAYGSWRRCAGLNSQQPLTGRRAG